MSSTPGDASPGPRRRPDDPDTDATRATRAQVEAESNTSPRTLADLERLQREIQGTAPRTPAPADPAY